LKQKAEQAKDYRTALARVREMSRLLELVMRLAVEMQERASSDFDFDGRPLEQWSDVELLQILARGQGMTETKFMRIARGQFSQDSVSSESKLKGSGGQSDSGGGRQGLSSRP
jgi:predicted nucleotidyltransferase